MLELQAAEVIFLPRTPDPELEQRVAQAALCLLDAGGLPAITLRAVAREARTTTPTIYERFTNREKLLQSVRRKAALELVSAVGRVQTMTSFVNGLVEFCVQHPQRFELIGDTVCFHPVAGHPMPVYQLLKAQLTREVGVHGTRREQLAMAITSLALGTVRGMIAAGSDTPVAKELHRTCLTALQHLLKVFTGLHPGPDDAGPIYNQPQRYAPHQVP